MKLKYVFYAINGTGCGHIMRCNNIARELYLLSQAIKIKADIRILTTSEADTISDFLTYKIPSKTIINQSDADNATYIADGSMFVLNIMSSFRPDVLIVDTIPQGSFDEFLMLRTQAKSTVFINRHKNEEVAGSISNQNAMDLYNLILTPDTPDQANRYIFNTRTKLKNRFVGRVHGYNPNTALNSEELKAYFDIPDEHKVIYISTGGGGDKTTNEKLKLLIQSLKILPDVTLIVGYGPLYKGDKVYARNVIPITETNVSRFFGGIDYAFSAAGYNSFEELLSAKVPTVFYPLQKGFDLQDERIKIAQGLGLCLFTNELESTQNIQNLYNKLTQIEVALKNAMNLRSYQSGATSAAFNILKSRLIKSDGLLLDLFFVNHLRKLQLEMVIKLPKLEFLQTSLQLLKLKFTINEIKQLEEQITIDSSDNNELLDIIDETQKLLIV
jgi:UDP-N-acetylglucosamine--N-acetylmuramyl-(pentapeptide) pyrophosphoryl-undecaprenol N-acetylglucosamine transferase